MVDRAGDGQWAAVVRAEFSALMTDDAGRMWMGTHTDGIQIVDAGTARVQTLRPAVSRPDATMVPRSRSMS